MVRPESNAKLDKVIASLSEGFNTEEIAASLMKIREDALADKDPLLAKVLRLASEYLDAEGCFDHTVEKIETEEGEEVLVEPGTDAENLAYFLELLKKSDNKYNREEIKEMRTFLKQKLY